jgi:chromosome segregation ATPase
MKKALVIGLIGAIALVGLAKFTGWDSYAKTWFARADRDIKNDLPAKFEIDRMRNEIASMDGDLSNMIRPIAEYRADIEMLRRDIARGTTTTAEQKKNLVPIVEQLQAGQKHIFVNNKKHTPEQVQAQLDRDLDRIKKAETDLKTKQKILDAKETSLKAAQDQLAKVVTKKREYQLRLAQLEAEAETLQVGQVGIDVKFDNTRAAQIEADLKAFEHRIETERARLDLLNHGVVNLQPNPQEPARPSLDLNAVRNYLEGNDESSKVADNR